MLAGRAPAVIQHRKTNPERHRRKAGLQRLPAHHGLPIGWDHAGNDQAKTRLPRTGNGCLSVDQLELKPLAGFTAKV